MEENKEWAPYSLREAPYWKDGMTPEEFDEARKQYYEELQNRGDSIG